VKSSVQANSAVVSEAVVMPKFALCTSVKTFSLTTED
jgi:hypothetical protein